MRALVMFDAAQPTERVANNIVKGLSEIGFKVDTIEAGDRRSQRAIPAANFDIVCAGASVTSFFGGQISSELDRMVKLSTGLAGKPVAVFVVPRLFGTGQALKRLMATMESQGAIVHDFAALRGAQEAIAFGRRLQALL